MEYRYLFYVMVVALAISLVSAENKEEIKDPSVVCKQQPEKGPCRALKKQWTYNAAEGKCQEFVFGGCRGNSNNFKTEAECKEFCGRK